MRALQRPECEGLHGARGYTHRDQCPALPRGFELPLESRPPHVGATDATIPSVAAVYVYPNLVPVAKGRTVGSGIKVASVAPRRAEAGALWEL